jgi:hypothetical protein
MKLNEIINGCAADYFGSEEQRGVSFYISIVRQGSDCEEARLTEDFSIVSPHPYRVCGYYSNFKVSVQSSGREIYSYEQNKAQTE